MKEEIFENTQKELMTNSLEGATGPRDVFLQLLCTVTFYITVIFLMILLFQSINILLPVEKDSYNALDRPIRLGIAAVAVAFPIYFILTRHLLGVYRRDSARREMRIKKWLTYFTLFAASVTFIVTLISLLYNFLDGDLTLRFGLKIAVVFIIAGLSFWYYHLELRDPSAKKIPFLAYLAMVIVLGSITLGLSAMAGYEYSLPEPPFFNDPFEMPPQEKDLLIRD